MAQPQIRSRFAPPAAIFELAAPPPPPVNGRGGGAGGAGGGGFGGGGSGSGGSGSSSCGLHKKDDDAGGVWSGAAWATPGSKPAGMTQATDGEVVIDMGGVTTRPRLELREGALVSADLDAGDLVGRHVQSPLRVEVRSSLRIDPDGTIILADQRPDGQARGAIMFAMAALVGLLNLIAVVMFVRLMGELVVGPLVGALVVAVVMFVGVIVLVVVLVVCSLVEVLVVVVRPLEDLRQRGHQ